MAERGHRMIALIRFSVPPRTAAEFAQLSVGCSWVSLGNPSHTEAPTVFVPQALGDGTIVLVGQFVKGSCANRKFSSTDHGGAAEVHPGHAI